MAGGSTGSTRCDTSASSWIVKAAGTSITNCKAQCQTYTVAGLIIDPGYTPSGAGASPVDNGGAKMAKFAATGEYCGAYNFDDAAETASAGTGCKIKKDSDTAAAISATTVHASSKCVVMNGASNGSDASSSKAAAAKQTAVKGAWDTVIATSNTLHTNMVVIIDAQADLEKAWLNAWYDEQYWVQVNAQLDTGTAGSLAKSYADQIALLGGTGTSVADNYTLANNAASSAQSAYDAAVAALALLQSAATTTAAVSNELGKRITRATAEIAELNTLSTTPAPATGFGTGTLDLQAKKRTEDYNAFASDGVVANFGTVPKGDKVKADEAKVAADLAVKARSAPTVADGGALTEARTLADAAWTTAKTNATAADDALSTALGSAVLATLRSTVATDTADWDTEETNLGNLVTAVTDAETALKTAQDELAKKTMNCQVAAYDSYRTSLEAAIVERGNKLKKIK